MTQLLGSFGHDGSTSKTGMRWFPPCARLSTSPRPTAATTTSPSSVRQDVVFMRAAYTMCHPWKAVRMPCMYIQLRRLDRIDPALRTTLHARRRQMKRLLGMVTIVITVAWVVDAASRKV